MIRHLLLPAVLPAVSVTPALAYSAEPYYPATNCQPFDGNGGHGGGSSGFAFLSTVGGLYNFDATHAEALVCPVPYFRDTNNLNRITVRIVVDDRHHLAFVRAFLCGRDS